MDNRDMDNKPSLLSNKVLILLAVCFLFVFVGIFANHNNHKSTKDEIETTMIGPLIPTSNVIIWKTLRRHHSFHHHHTHNSIKYVSKKLVPSAPNPRHNWIPPHS
ncbi:unnamed protein product [Cuscuta europaea]|uniref:Uncharacterized protein n=1 Tax=Cuscuta europaea TaxID=41803 RepID=A0A9P0ZUZ5_CUSEU|nr:unnamed protein product [Cuscuta europaea]